MKVAALAVLTVAVLCAPARADGVQAAFGAVGGQLQSHGGGLADFLGSCPKTDNDAWQWVGSAIYVPISPTDSAVVVNTGMCNGGNGQGQYLVMNRGASSRIVTNAGIGDMNFIATTAYFFDDTLTLYGNRWLPKDPHCCPSKKANLEFNLKTGAHKLTIVEGN